MVQNKSGSLGHSSAVFSLSEQTLRELLPLESNQLPTRNAFARNRQELESIFASLFVQDSEHSVLVFSDGVCKSSGISDVSIDQLIQDLFKVSQRKAEFISLSAVLQCDPKEVHASVSAVMSLSQSLRQQRPAAVLVVGSGSVTDVVKHALFSLGWNDTPFVVLPTALTVTAFTSHFAVLEEAGAKRTSLSRRVDTCVWFAPVLAAAPLEMTRAGYGDLLARFVAYGDWYLAWRLKVAERYDELAFHLMEPFADRLKTHAPELRNWPVNEHAIEDLAAALAMAGIAMSASGETTPLSGYEHTISHALDFLRLTSKRPLCWHGEQVALASLSSAESFDQLLAKEDLVFENQPSLSEERLKKIIQKLLLEAPYFGFDESQLSAPERSEKLAQMRDNIDRAVEIFSKDYLKKNAQWQKAQPSLPEVRTQWAQTRIHLRALVLSASELKSLLEQSGLAVTPEELSQPTTAFEYRWALRFAPFVRTRVSLADIIFWLGEDPALWTTS